MLQAELDDTFFTEVDEHLKTLRFHHGLLISARLGLGFKAARFVVRRPHPEHRSWRERLLPSLHNPYSVLIPERDDAGFRALGDIRAHGVNVISGALGQVVDHVLSFFAMLRTELAFYLGCLNLHQQLADAGMPTCFPQPLPTDGRTFTAAQLYDPGLVLRQEPAVTANDVSATGKGTLVITGANQGGKSTFLRSLGLAQLMLQAGMFVAAASASATLCSGVFTHFKREEDETLTSGKFDEELHRMSQLVDALQPQGLLLMNESFSATNETEGAEVGSAVIEGLRDAGVNTAIVTHSFDLAHRLYDQMRPDTLFLRAERTEGGDRTYHVTEGEPLTTSYGGDLYQRIFTDRGAPLRQDDRTERAQ
jgi:DNA mismatch repair ATPase MutS